MSFRETHEIKAGNPAERVAWSWLREIFLADWGLKLLALAITLGLWYGVTSQRAPGRIRLRGVQLYFLRPDDVEIANEPREEVEITLAGQSNEFEELVARRNLVATVDIGAYSVGEYVVRLTPTTVAMNLPEGIRIEKIEPSSVPLRIERRIEREIEVAAKLEGDLPDGLELRHVEVVPNKVMVRGPESQVTRLQKVSTEPIFLSGRNETFSLPQTSIDIRERKVVALDPVVRVNIGIGELRLEKQLNGVPVTATGGDSPKAIPRTVNVIVRGARSLTERLTADKIRIILEKSGDGSFQPRLVTSLGFEGQLELISTTPSIFPIKK